jgi:HAD superfamily hydrolase (TIGR01509 family)
MIKGVIFDLEGTLVDVWEVYAEIVRQIAIKFNLSPIPKQELFTLVDQGYNLKEVFSKFYPFADKETLSNWMKEGDRLFVENPFSIKPEVKEMLQSLKGRGLRMGIVTSTPFPPDAIWSWVGELGIKDFFEVVITGTEAPRKPAPDSIIKCVEKLRLSPEECLSVGDSRADIVAGRGAGVKTVAFSGGVATKETLLAEKPDFSIEELTQFPSLLSD